MVLCRLVKAKLYLLFKIHYNASNGDTDCCCKTNDWLFSWSQCPKQILGLRSLAEIKHSDWLFQAPWQFFFKNWAIPGLFFFIFVFSTVNSKYLCNKILPRLNSNKGPLVSEATALLIERQPQPDRYCNVGLILKLSSSSPTTTVLGCSLSTSAKGTTTGSMRRRPTGMNKMKV